MVMIRTPGTAQSAARSAAQSAARSAARSRILALAALVGLAAPLAAADEGLTRSQIVRSADRYARLHWVMTETHRTGTGCGGGFVSDYPLGPRIGMAYKWGAWDTIEEFTARIAAGHGAGTRGGARVYDDYPRDCVTGISCTGLVSRAWGLRERHTLNYARPGITRRLAEVSHPIAGVALEPGAGARLRKGDAFINRRHVILFVYETRDGRPMVIDARPPGVRFRRTSWEILARNDYAPIRCAHVVETPEEPGSLAHPIEIATLPFTVEGNTRDVVSLAIDRYSAAPDRYSAAPDRDSAAPDRYSAAPERDQRGPEVVFAVTLERAGRLTARITDCKAERIDNDLHLLGDLTLGDQRTAIHCLARGDRKLSRWLEPGRYFLVVDSGRDRPGEFALRVGVE